MEYEDLITELKVLSMIQDNDRLCVHYGRMTIENLTWKQNNVFTQSFIALHRWWNKDSRYITLLKLESIIVKSCYVYNELHESEKKSQFVQICHEAANGFSKLQSTYSNDAAICARISIYAQKLASFQ